ncbi:MMPL family transporter [Streptomyces rubellomurinus]|uniref:Membrane protein n=1 Tax=Streptomyces rubellomurinus (strain ATCC 31215) TaxID=359131 RepID=A0A0F2T7Z5_STRR3|nr:MMPL family transporter [Streptomyces rubellomurinus]KJS59343.1 membrane protein [Streptomyces rubellomurinus]
MFHRLGQFVVRRAWWVIAAWVVAAFAIIAGAPQLKSNSDESAFLPKHYESIQASDLQQKAFPSNISPGALLLFQRNDGGALDEGDKATMAKVIQGLADKHIELVDQVLPVNEQGYSADKKFAMSMVSIDKSKFADDKFPEAAKKLREEGTALTSGTSVKVQVGGAAASNLDQKDAGSTAQMLIGLGTIVIILLTLGIIFRSPIIALLPVVTVIVYSMVATGLIGFAADWFGLKADNSMEMILTVVLYGVGTDYFLFLMFRYRERLRAGDDRRTAVANAVGRVGEAITSAAGAVVVAFAVLVLSSLGMFKALGPALAIAVAVTAVASVTLVPAIISRIPEKVLFWPSKAWQREPSNARFAAIGRTVGRRPAATAVLSGLVMVGLAVAALGYKGTFDMAGSSMPKSKESMVVQDTMAKAFSAGAGDPAHVYLTSQNGSKLDPASLQGYVSDLGKVPGVSQAAMDSEHSVSPDGQTVDITLVLADDSASNKAIDTIGDVRKAAHDKAPEGTKALVAGTASVYKDINTAMAHDYSLVFPIAAVLIMIILGLLLRSVVAPWYLMASVGLGFGATLGATTLVFQDFKGEPGLMFMLPILIYLFVVALGTDYNILMIARLREEAREGRDPREAASMAIRHGGPTVAAAGFILAGTFATMLLAGNTLSSEMGFSIAMGILIAAFVMAMFFTPALTALLGQRAWWPGHADTGGHGAGQAPLAGSHGVPEPAGRR